MVRNIPPAFSLNRLLYRCFIVSIAICCLIAGWEYFADPDPVGPGTFVFYGFITTLALGVQWAMYKTKFRLLLHTYPAFISNILGIVIFYIFFFLKQPILLFGLLLLILVALAWHWIAAYKTEQ